ncbi:solute carrier family 23 member 1-like isoform X2 [Varroa jacobsoni]|uniref:Solute carrier family 23 member 2 n=1 Tax=Varroa destructor TaxID=109461 RepID=A0A7M7MD69_VARDE|nr:solute carrier family 23 member 1-like isoform X2 [Varroa destructor]XP_022699352.1 solute carrier family 23 member 1-like isoform X2 [Varroa jacobsoni]
MHAEAHKDASDIKENQLGKIDEEEGMISRGNKVHKDDLLYGLEDSPPWYLSALLGFQQYLIASSGSLSYPFMLAPAICMRDSDPARGYLISTIFFISGITTIFQTTFGIRLPIVQGCSVTFLVPIVAIMSLPEWKCPTEEQIIAARLNNSTGPVTDDEWSLLWQTRIREISGAIMIASVFEVLLGATGIVGSILKWVTPLGIAPTIALIGLFLFEEAATLCSKNWAVSIMAIVLMTLFSQYLTNVECLLPSVNKNGLTMKRVAIFKIFPILMALAVSWAICAIFTLTDYFGPTNLARTDLRVNIIRDSAWIRLPYPAQFGGPTFTVGAVIGMLSAILGSIVESIGDYLACASLARAPPPPKHAINRGIMSEGVGCILAGVFGAGCGLTSYSGNISIIALTKVACRSVINWAAVYMIMFGIVGKVGATFATIPDPVIGGVFVVMFSLIAGVGISSARKVDLTSSRNLFILGVSLFGGIMVAHWARKHSDAIKTGNEMLDQTITILFSTSMFVGGSLGIFLDNTIPGTLAERGLIEDHYHHQKEPNLACYGMPFLGQHFERLPFLPFSPSYTKNPIPGLIRSISRQSRRSNCGATQSPKVAGPNGLSGKEMGEGQL